MPMKRKPLASRQPDPDDAPVLTAADLERGTWRIGDKLVSRKLAQAAIAKRGRPPKADAKVAVKLRLDPDLLAVLKATGPGWQTRANRILRERFVM